MKLSQYNRLVVVEDGTLLYNAVNGAMLLLNDKQLARYKKVCEGDFSDEKYVERLIEMGYVITIDDEHAPMREKYESFINDTQQKHLFITVTDRCNLGCSYCYEEKSDWINMTPETQETLKLWIDKFLDPSTTHFSVTWFGGEPLMNLPAIENLNAHIQQRCNERNITYYHMIITNGTLIPDRVADRLAATGLSTAQITVDGFKDDHDKSRPYLKDIPIDELSPIRWHKGRRQIAA
jgi:uncharacterized protein